LIGHRAFVGLGSNLDDPVSQVLLALTALSALPRARLVARSGLYVGPPMGPQDQPDYINAVAELRVRGTPDELLADLQRIEQGQGRRRHGERWGPRTLDLDLLLFDQLVIAQSGLRVPHPGLCQRDFVLVPLCEIAPDVQVPGEGCARDLVRGLGETGLRRIADVPPRACALP
jgi:2-amino-4-hydroxy-6-hydroxymethyldihydropteridine diphosphokinase